MTSRDFFLLNLTSSIEIKIKSIMVYMFGVTQKAYLSPPTISCVNCLRNLLCSHLKFLSFSFFNFPCVNCIFHEKTVTNFLANILPQSEETKYFFPFAIIFKIC